MGKETFAETLSTELKKYRVFECHEVLLGVKYKDLLIETFKTYGNFLNHIPIEVRNKFIEENLLDWIFNYYYINPIIDKSNASRKSFYPQIDASKKIKQIEKTLQNFQDLIQDQFGDLIEEMEKYGDDFHIDGEYLNKLKQVSNTLNTAKLLQEDIKKKNFQWFNRSRFYKYIPISKQELKRIIKNAKHQYNLNVTELSIKELIDNIPPF